MKIDPDEIEICPFCGEIVIDISHDCRADNGDESYSARLKKGFEMLEMEEEK